MPIRKVSVSDRNKEKLITPILKEEKGRRLVSVTNDGEILNMFFSVENNWALKYAVKQYAKSKYKSKEECVAHFIDTRSIFFKQSRWRVIKVIDLPKVWLIFFERNF